MVCSDGGVFASSALKPNLDRNHLNVPAEDFVSVGVMLPYVIVADDAFPLCQRMMKPYPCADIPFDARIHNYRISRARRTF